MIKTKENWTRDPSFRKYFGSVFGLSKSGDAYRLDIGNEKIHINDSEIVNVSECQIILPQESFDALVGLLCKVQEEEKTKPKSKKI